MLALSLASPRPDPFRKRALVVRPPPQNRLSDQRRTARLTLHRQHCSQVASWAQGMAVSGIPPDPPAPHAPFFPSKCRITPHRGSRDHWPPALHVGVGLYVRQCFMIGIYSDWVLVSPLHWVWCRDPATLRMVGEIPGSRTV